MPPLQADMGILLVFMFIRNMVDAVVLIPTLAHFLLVPDEGTCAPHPMSFRTEGEESRPSNAEILRFAQNDTSPVALRTERRFNALLTPQEPNGMATITVLLQRARDGHSTARDELFALAYDNLKQLARARLRGGGRNTELDTTALVHEAYLRFIGTGDLRAGDRRAFFAYASSVMRSVIVDSARERLAERRGGDVVHLTLTTQMVEGMAADEEAILRVHEALTALEAADSRMAKVVEMRYFGGYTDQEIAEALDITDRTVRRDWEKARLLLEVALK